jgi:hypothetical protein
MRPLFIVLLSPSATTIALFVPAFGVGWLGLAQQKIDSGPDAYGLMQAEMPQTEDANKPDGDQINGDNETQ